LGKHAAAKQPRALVSIDLIVLGLTCVDSLHVEGMAQPKGNPWAQRSASQSPVKRQCTATAISPR
jgi:hypothetical protein